MTPETLLSDLEPLSHAERIRSMVEIGRRSLTDSSVVAILATLERGDFYERLLSLQSCFGSYDGKHVLRSLNDPSRIIRSLAVSLVTLTCDQEQLRSALDTVPAQLRVPLVWKLCKAHHQEIIDAFLDFIATAGDKQFHKLLPFGSPAVVQHYMERFLRNAELSDWCRLARLQPTIALDELQKRAGDTTVLDQQFVWLVNAVLPVLARKQPEATVALVTTMAQYIPLSHFKLQSLAQCRPVEVAELVLHADEQVELDFTRFTHHLPVEQIVALMKRYSQTIRVQDSGNNWFRKLTPEQRVAIYMDCKHGLLDEDGALPEWLVGLLPRVQREEEGRHHLALASYINRPADRLPYATFLPWDEARTALEPFIHSSDAELRAKSLGALIASVRYQRSHLPDVLSIVRAHENEQDPVRLRMLDNLANLPPSIWCQEHLESLASIIRAAFDAIDISEPTINAATRLVLDVLRYDTAWVTTQLAIIMSKYGNAAFRRKLKGLLSNAQMQRLVPALLPVLQLWEKQENEKELWMMAQNFASYLHIFDELVDVLEGALQRTHSTNFADIVLPLLVKYRPDRAKILIPALLEEDASWLTRPTLCLYLHRYRQDLLTPFLRQQAYSGRFGTSNASLFLPLYDTSFPQRRWRGKMGQQYMLRGFSRWTRWQQETYAAMPNGVIHETGQSNHVITKAIAQLAALPALTTTPLLALAHDERPIVRDTTLLTLAHLDGGQGIPVLLQALHDDRARVAIHALYNYFVNAPEQETLPLLRNIPLDRVTVAKEVIRIIGTLSSEDAYRTLLELHHRELHIDVRIALTRVLWNHLDRPETWQVLEQNARSSDGAIALSAAHLRLSPDLRKESAQVHRMNHAHRAKHIQYRGITEWTRMNVSRISPYHLTFAQQQRLMHLFVLLLQHSQLEVRITTLRYCTRIAEADIEQTLLVHLLDAMHSNLESEVTPSAVAVFGTCTTADTSLIGRAIEGLLANRRALQIATQILQYALFTNGRQLLPTVREILTVLAADSLTTSLRVELAIVALPWDEVAAILAQLAATNELHADALNRTCEALQVAINRPDFLDMVNLELAFAGSNDERLRRIALAALLAQTQSPHGWSDEQVTRLQFYRLDKSPLVATTAQFTFPVVEQR